MQTKSSKSSKHKLSRRIKRSVKARPAISKRRKSRPTKPKLSRCKAAKPKQICKPLKRRPAQLTRKLRRPTAKASKGITGIKVVIVGKYLTVYIGNKPHTLPIAHPRFQEIMVAIRAQDRDALVKIFDIPRTVRAEGFKLKDGQAFFEGKPVHNNVTDKILELWKHKKAFQPLIRFLTNAGSCQAAADIYDFMANKHLVLTHRGTVLAYKATRENFFDKYTGTIDNHPGCKPSMPREQVDNNRNSGCGRGLHIGSWDYVQSFGGGTDRRLLVEIEPCNVVSVPLDSSCQKMRTCAYTVLREIKQPLDDISITEAEYQAIVAGT